MRRMPAGEAVAGVRAVPVRRGGLVEQDFVVVEAPLEIRLDGRPLVVTMRTPGHDAELAAGFLYAEGLITGKADLASLQAVAGGGSDRGSAGGRIRVTDFSGDRVEAVLANAAAEPAAAGPPSGPDPAAPLPEREFRATAACGVCGKASLDEVERDLPPVTPIDCRPELLEALPGRLREAQTLFDATGGIHAAGIFTADGDLLCLREDVGRHNAVDKATGCCLLRDETPLAGRILVVSGRAGFELVQKAIAAAIPVMVSVGAASSVAVEMAAAAGMTLYSFAGRGRGNLHLPEA